VLGGKTVAVLQIANDPVNREFRQYNDAQAEKKD